MNQMTFVIATGKQYSVKEFIEEAAPYFGIKIAWLKNNSEEVGYDMNTSRIVIRVDPKDFRLAEV